MDRNQRIIQIAVLSGLILVAAFLALSMMVLAPTLR